MRAERKKKNRELGDKESRLGKMREKQRWRVCEIQNVGVETKTGSWEKEGDKDAEFGAGW